MTKFAQLLNQKKNLPKLVHRGETVDGKVISILPGRVILDIGAKSEGQISGEEYQETRDFIKRLNVGDWVRATVTTLETPEGFALCSLKNSAWDFALQILEQASNTGEAIPAKVLKKSSPGLSVEVLGISSFIPNVQIGKKLLEEPQVIGKTIRVAVLDLDKNTGQVSLSERAISEKDQIEKQKEALLSISPGEKYVGEVTKLVPFGTFVEIFKDGVALTGLVHLSEISWEKVTDPSTKVAVGNKLEVVVLEEKEGRLSLSIKRAQKDPWDKLRLLPESVVRGRVIREAARHWAIEIQPGIEGSALKSKIPPSMVLRIGEELNFFVEEFDGEKRKISLGLQLKEKPVGYK